jgi:tetratricopeptide (TPR) repeat protein
MEARFNQLTFNLTLPDSLFLIPERAFANKSNLIAPKSNLTSSADSLYAIGQYERAVEYYTNVVKSNDRDAYAYNARGLARIALKEY